MKTHLALTAIFCGAGIFAMAQTDAITPSAGHLRLGAYELTHTDAFSIGANTASLAAVPTFSIGFYNEKKFMLSGLATYILTAAYPVKWGSFGTSLSYFGTPSFHQTSLALAYAQKLSPAAEIGVQFNYRLLNEGMYGSLSFLSASAGLRIHLTDQLLTGIEVANLSGYHPANDQLAPPLVAAGLGYEISKQLFAGTEVIKEMGKPTQLLSGLKYQVDEKLFFKGGVSAAITSFYFGSGFFWKGLLFEVSASIHPLLGTTPGLSILYKSTEQKK